MSDFEFLVASLNQGHHRMMPRFGSSEDFNHEFDSLPDDPEDEGVIYDEY